MSCPCWWLSLTLSSPLQGLERNKDYITRGMRKLFTNPSQSFSSAFINAHRPPHFQHTRAACSTQRCVFLTNVDSLPPLAPSDSESNRTLQEHEQNFGYVGPLQSHRASRAEKPVQEAEQWAVAHPYIAAVDGDFGSSWRSTRGSLLCGFFLAFHSSNSELTATPPLNSHHVGRLHWPRSLRTLARAHHGEIESDHGVRRSYLAPHQSRSVAGWVLLGKWTKHRGGTLTVNQLTTVPHATAAGPKSKRPRVPLHHY